MGETIDLRVRIRALIATLDRLALRAFTRHGDDAQLYNGLKDAVSELEALSVLHGEAPEVIRTPPDPPHLREDYREVWLSGWRAGAGARPEE